MWIRVRSSSGGGGQGTAALCEPAPREYEGRTSRPSRRGGRPPLGSESTTTVTLRMEPSMLARVDEGARAAGMTRSAYMRQALLGALERGLG